MGPSVNAGKKDKAAKIMMTANVINPNVSVSVFRVPALSGIYFLLAKIPAMAIGPMIGKYLDKIIMIPQLMFHQGVLSPKPSKPLPLFAAEDVYSYNISLKP